MNILVVAHYQGDGSPTAIFVHDQVKAYQELGHTVRVIVPIALGKKGYDGNRLVGGVTVLDGVWHYYVRHLSLSRYGQKHFNKASAIAALRVGMPTILRDFKPDVIHAHTFGFDSGIGVWLKKKTSCPLVVTTHGSDVSVPYEEGKRDYIKGCCENMDCVVGVSSALAEKVKSCGVDIPVRSILNGFNLQYLPENLEKAPLTFLQVSSLIVQKKVDVTIRAYAQIRQQYPEAKLTVVGQGPERENLEKLCIELGVLDGVTFTGQISNDKVLKEMGKAQFFVMPSVREGFGIVYLEAMSCGCVTIGTQGEGIADLIVNGENGFLVPPNDPGAIAGVICRCQDCPDVVQAVTKRGKDAARALTWKTNAEKYAELFQALIERKLEK